MDIKNLNIGVIHSQIGKNDGVSIVIDQTIHAMTKNLGIPLGNIYYLSGISASRLQAEVHNAFWHKNESNQRILSQFSSKPDDDLDEYIMSKALVAKNKVKEWVEKNNIDLLLVHNSCHPTNFVYSVGIGLYFEELRAQGIISPKYLLWWHDSHFERERFSKPNDVIKKYLPYIPGPHVDGIVFINSTQSKMADAYCKSINKQDKELFFDRKTAVIPNTIGITWDWQNIDKSDKKFLSPDMDNYFSNFFRDIGLEEQLKNIDKTIDETALLLQHTRIVERKKIEHALDFAFKLEKKHQSEGNDKAVALIVSGNSGDEHDNYTQFLENHYKKRCEENPDISKNVIFIMAENYIFPVREMLPDRKLYPFDEVPKYIANLGGMGTYFSSIEGYGNNLLEMMESGLPVIINEYEIYKSDIKPLGFDLIETENGNITDEAVNRAYNLLNNRKARRECVRHNLSILEEKLNHGVMAESLGKIVKNLFKYR